MPTIGRSVYKNSLSQSKDTLIANTIDNMLTKCIIYIIVIQTFELVEFPPWLFRVVDFEGSSYNYCGVASEIESKGWISKHTKSSELRFSGTYYAIAMNMNHNIVHKPLLFSFLSHCTILHKSNTYLVLDTP